MKQESIIAIAATPAVVKLVPEDRFLNRVAGLRELIARRAYQFFEEAGFTHGHDIDHWLRAESQLQMPTALELSETDNRIQVKAELPGFDAKDIEIHVQPRRLFVSGEKLKQSENREGENEKQKTLHSEQTVQRIFRCIDLPAEIDPAQVTATLKNGQLQVDLPKVEAGKVEAGKVKAQKVETMKAVA